MWNSTNQLSQVITLRRARFDVVNGLHPLVSVGGETRKHRRVAIVELPVLRDAERALNAHHVIDLRKFIGVCDELILRCTRNHDLDGRGLAAAKALSGNVVRNDDSVVFWQDAIIDLTEFDPAAQRDQTAQGEQRDQQHRHWALHHEPSNRGPRPRVFRRQVTAQHLEFVEAVAHQTHGRRQRENRSEHAKHDHCETGHGERTQEVLREERHRQQHQSNRQTREHHRATRGQNRGFNSLGDQPPALAFLAIAVDH